MSRGLAGAVTAALSDDHITMVAMVKLEYDSGTQLYHSGVGEVTYDSGDGVETYLGIGKLGSIEPIVEELGIKMSGIRMMLSGVDTTSVDLVVSEQIQGRTASVFMGLYDYELGNITEAFEIFSGYMDVSEVDRGKQGSMTLTVESIFAQFDLPNIKKFTDEDHQERYPGDTFFDGLTNVVENEIVWGPKNLGIGTAPRDNGPPGRGSWIP